MILYDLGLYYLKMIRWIATYPIVPGLANLQGHLGFNQPGFLITALLDGILPERLGIFLTGGILPWLGLTSALFSLFSLSLHAMGRLSAPRPMVVAYACSFPVWIYAFLSENLSSGSPNLILACVMIHFFLVFACFLFSPAERRENFGEVLVIGAACLCLKLTSLGLVVSVWAVAVAVMISTGIVAEHDGSPDSACFWSLCGAVVGLDLPGDNPFRLSVLSVEFSCGTRRMARARICAQRLSKLHFALGALSTW